MGNLFGTKEEIIARRSGTSSGRTESKFKGKDPQQQNTIAGSDAGSVHTMTNPIKEAENLIKQTEKDIEASLINTVTGSDLVDPNSTASADAQVEGHLISAVTGGAAESEDQLENMLINAVIGGFMGG